MCMVRPQVFVLDAFTGNVVKRFTTNMPDGSGALEATFSPDNQYVLSGRALTGVHHVLCV